MLAACSGNSLPASVLGGECKVFERPEYVVRGAKRYDQNWIDGNIEAGVGGCGWKRPKPRPASFDTTSPGSAVATSPAPPVKKLSLYARAKAKLLHRKPVAGSVAPREAPAAAAPLPPPVLSVPARPLTPGNFDPPATPAPVLPPPKRTPLEELLTPK
jgi:hypothetical protein